MLTLSLVVFYIKFVVDAQKSLQQKALLKYLWVGSRDGGTGRWVWQWSMAPFCDAASEMNLGICNYNIHTNFLQRDGLGHGQL
jgi:hypothetical protein